MRIERHFSKTHLLVASCGTIALLLSLLLFPSIPSSAHAEVPLDVADTDTLHITTPTPSVSIATPATIEFADVITTPSGATTTASARINVTTTDSASYSLYIYGADGNSLKSLNPNTTQSITSASASSINNFTNNTWGYNLTEGTTAGTTYSALPTTNTTPTQTKDTSTTNSANDTYTLSLGAKVDSTIPSGTYTSTLTISVVAEPRKLTLSDITDMQDMTPEICAASSENETKRLIDARDQKLYWVAKLKDGNCWMTQNLDLDLKASEPLTSADSDISDSRGSWTPTDTQNNTTGFIDTYGMQSFDSGMYVYNLANWNACNNYWSGGSCANWTNVSGMSPMTTIRAESASVVNIPNGTYDAHYLTGNYYQWNAATAGTGDESVTNGDAVDSICPKGWRLPSRGDSDETNEFYGLIIKDNITTGPMIVKAPYYFIPAGYVYSGSMNSAGNYGRYWSSTAYNSTDAYLLSFEYGTISPSGNNSRYYGRSVRCLAR